jgi:2-polyprenyl-6-methoxyphenol hydroxylase-like FAD-dependent oxidoreductase
MKHIGQHAIVIGASMGGLLAARALADFYAVITVLERDTFPQSDMLMMSVDGGKGTLRLGASRSWFDP